MTDDHLAASAAFCVLRLHGVMGARVTNGGGGRIGYQPILIPEEGMLSLTLLARVSNSEDIKVTVYAGEKSITGVTLNGSSIDSWTVTGDGGVTIYGVVSSYEDGVFEIAW